MFENIRRDFETHGRDLREPGLWALAVYRFGVWRTRPGRRRQRPVRWLTYGLYEGLHQFVMCTSGVVLYPETEVGEGIHFIHGNGVQISPGTVIGKRCGIMHRVTLGTNMKGGPPTIGDDVFIGCGASILGEVTIGDGARIAANSLVITDVPPGAVAIGVPAKIYPNMDRLRTPQKTTTTKAPATEVVRLSLLSPGQHRTANENSGETIVDEVAG